MHWDALECGYFRGPIRASCSHCHPFVAVTRDVLLSPGMYMTYSAHQVCREKLLANPHHTYDDCINIYVKPIQPKDFTWSLCFTPLGGLFPAWFSVLRNEVIRDSSCVGRWVLPPRSKPQMTWTFLGSLFILWDPLVGEWNGWKSVANPYNLGKDRRWEYPSEISVGVFLSGIFVSYSLHSVVEVFAVFKLACEWFFSWVGLHLWKRWSSPLFHLFGDFHSIGGLRVTILLGRNYPCRTVKFQNPWAITSFVTNFLTKSQFCDSLFLVSSLKTSTSSVFIFLCPALWLLFGALHFFSTQKNWSNHGLSSGGLGFLVGFDYNSLGIFPTLRRSGYFHHHGSDAGRERWWFFQWMLWRGWRLLKQKSLDILSFFF